jgi:membrane protein
LLVALLTLIAIGFAPVLELLVGLETGLLSSRWQAVLDTAVGHVTSLIISAAILTLIYMLVAYERPGWKQAMPGIAVATCMIEAGKSLFVYYVEHASRFDSVYGSLSSMIVLLIWLYFSARVLLYGAEVICICVQDAEP